MPGSSKQVTVTAELAQLISLARLDCGLGLEEVARQSGVSSSRVLAITRGKYSRAGAGRHRTRTEPETLARVAATVGLDAGQVLRDRDVDESTITTVLEALQAGEPAETGGIRTVGARQILSKFGAKLRRHPGTWRPYPYPVVNHRSVTGRINAGSVKSLGPGMRAELRDDGQVWVTYDPQPEPIRETA